MPDHPKRQKTRPPYEGELVHTNITWVSIPVQQKKLTAIQPPIPNNPHSNATTPAAITITPDVQNSKPANPAAPAVTTLVSGPVYPPYPTVVAATTARVNVDISPAEPP